jgi:putative DNA primase/helicase
MVKKVPREPVRDYVGEVLAEVPGTAEYKAAHAHRGAATARSSNGKVSPVHTNGGGDDAISTVEETEFNTGTVPPPTPPTFLSFGNFTMNAESGLTAAVEKGVGRNARVDTVWISSPFEVLGRARDPESNAWSRWLRWKDPDGRTHTYAVQDEKLHEELTVLCGALAQRGLIISTKATSRALFAAYLNGADPQKRVRVVSRTGWLTIGDTKVFVLPDRTLGVVGEEVIFSGTLASPYAANGTLDEWRDSVGNLVSGHDRPMFMDAASLAAPLMDLIGMEGAGFHLFGPSSGGKTTSLQAAASVWGRGTTHGFVRPWKSTANNLEGTAALHNDAPMPLDEINAADGREVGSVVYMLAGGVGKGRAGRDGKPRPSAIWRTMILSTGEQCIGDKIAEDGKRAHAGQEVRVINISSDAGAGHGVDAGTDFDPEQLSDNIKAAAAKNYGTAGPAFIEAVIKRGCTKVAAEIDHAFGQFRTANNLIGVGGQVGRAAKYFALVAYAGELAITAGIVRWKAGAVTSAASRLFVLWLRARGGTGQAETRNAVAQVAEIIARFGSSRLDPIDGTDRPAPNRLGRRREVRLSGGGTRKEYLVPAGTWRSEFCKGFDAASVANMLADLGVIIRDSEGKTSQSIRVQGDKQRLYVLDGGKLAEVAA